MKISKEEKIIIKNSILKNAINLIKEHGYKKVSMSKIAKSSNISEATIYNYYKTKEHILFEYYYQLQIDTKKILLDIDGFSQFSLKEQIQLLLNTELEILQKDRAFVLAIYDEIFYKSFKNPELERANGELIDMIEELVDIAIESNEIEPLPFSTTILPLFSSYYYGIVYYWINDDSDYYDNTTIMIDKSLDLIYTILQSGMISKAEELINFVIKTHILNKLKSKKSFDKKRVFGEKDAR
jgi:AcrR family transcriptional regulator